MQTPPAHSLAWFEVAVDDVDLVAPFYAQLFGWHYTPDPNALAQGADYRLVTLPGADMPMGGLTTAPPGQPGHAVFSILVADVAATCESTTALGGSVVWAETAPPAGPAFAYLRDPAGSLFQVFSRPTG